MTSFERTRAAAQRSVDAAPGSGVQLHAWTTAGPELGYQAGLAGPGRPMRADSIVRWLSGSKPVVAVAVARLWERNQLALDEPVRRHLPEMRRPDVTVRHLLTHTAGFRDDPPPGALVQQWDEAVRRACSSELEDGWRPGWSARYSTWTSFLLLAEIVRRVDGRPFDEYVRAEVFGPLGMDDCSFTMTREAYAGVADRVAELAHVAPDGLVADPLLNDPALAGRCWPALGLRGPAGQLSRLLRALLPGAGRDLGRVLAPPTVEAMSLRQYVGIRYQEYLKKVSWGLGVLAGPEMFGPYCSDRTFGGRGHGSSVLLVDPAHELVMAAAWTGMLDDERRHGARVRELAAALYEDLGLAVHTRRRAAPVGPAPVTDSGSELMSQLLSAARGLDDGQLTALVGEFGGPTGLLACFREALRRAVSADRARAGTVHLTVTWAGEPLRYRLDVSDTGSVTLDQVEVSSVPQTGLRLTVDGCDLTRLLTGELDAKTAFAQGRLEVAGDVSMVGTLLPAFSGTVFAIGTP